MADDLVAELTLRLRNEMQAGFDEARSEFSDLQESVTGLNSNLSETDQMMAEMRAPLGLQEGFRTAAAEADGIASAVLKVIPAIDDDISAMKKFIAEMTTVESAANQMGDSLVESWQAIGIEIQKEMTSVEQFSAELTNVMNEMADAQAGTAELVAGGGGAGGGSGGGGDEDETPGAPKGHSASGHGGGLDMIGTLLGLAMGKGEFDAWADFDTLARQITVTEGLSPGASDHEVSRLKDLTDHLANRYAASSTDLLEGYEYLITDRVPKQQVEAMLPSLAEASTAYNVPAADISQAAFAELRQLHIAPDDIGNSLAVLHHASMQGHFGISDFGRYLGGIAGQADVMGIGGTKGNVLLASALEAIQEQTNDSGETDTELRNLLEYLREPIAQRSFDPTKRTLSMDSEAGRRLRKEYHLPATDLNAYLNSELKQGVDPINATLDFFDKNLSDVKSPIDVGNIMGMYFHNQTAAQAFFALYQQQHIFDQMQGSLSHVNDSTLANDWYTATAGSSADSRVLSETGDEASRIFGKGIDYLAVQPFNSLWNWGSPGGYGPDGTPEGRAPAGAGLNITPMIPITVNVRVDKDGNVAVTGGVTGAPANAPGTNVRVNQGNVLTGHN